MKTSKIFFLATMLLAMISCEQKNAENTTGEIPLLPTVEYYQLKTYTFDNEEQVQMTDRYLKNAFLPGLKRLGINQIGVSKPRQDAADTTKKTYVLIPLSSIEQLNPLEEALAQDSTYLTAGSEYIAATYDQPRYKRIESTLLKAFEDMPAMKTDGHSDS